MLPPESDCTLGGISCFCVTDFEWLAGDLYAAGQHWGAGATLMKPAGDSWTKLDQDTPSRGGSMNALQRLGPDLYVGGEFDTSSNDGAFKTNKVAVLHNAARPTATKTTPKS